MSFLQHDTADKNDVWNLRSPIYFRTNQHENLLVTYLCNEMSLFCYIARSSYRRHSVSFTWQLIWGNIIFVSVVAWITTLNFCASDCANETQNNYIIPFFLIWLFQSYEKKSSSRTVNDNVPLINHLNNSIVCFLTICIVLDAYNVHKPSNENFAPVESQSLRWTKKSTATLNKNRQFVYSVMSIVSNIIYAIADLHCCFSSDIISCCATCFAQIEMFLMQCYNSTVSLGYPPTCNEAGIYLSTLETALQNRPSWKWKFFTA